MIDLDLDGIVVITSGLGGVATHCVVCYLEVPQKAASEMGPADPTNS